MFFITFMFLFLFFFTFGFFVHQCKNIVNGTPNKFRDYVYFSVGLCAVLSPLMLFYWKDVFIFPFVLLVLGLLFMLGEIIIGMRENVDSNFEYLCQLYFVGWLSAFMFISIFGKYMGGFIPMLMVFWDEYMGGFIFILSFILFLFSVYVMTVGVERIKGVFIQNKD